MAYVDGFVLAVPTRNLARYKKVSTVAGKLWIEHGALQYIECEGDDLEHEGMFLPFTGTVKCKPDETVLFSWIMYKSRRHRDQVNSRVMADPRMERMHEEMMRTPTHDHKRMAYGGFKPLVQLNAK